jgi:hypothetical protein
LRNSPACKPSLWGSRCLLHAEAPEVGCGTHLLLLEVLDPAGPTAEVGLHPLLDREDGVGIQARLRQRHAVTQEMTLGLKRKEKGVKKSPGKSHTWDSPGMAAPCQGDFGDSFGCVWRRGQKHWPCGSRPSTVWPHSKGHPASVVTVPSLSTGGPQGAATPRGLFFVVCFLRQGLGR